jgi:biopolymer transport protein ExbB
MRNLTKLTPAVWMLLFAAWFTAGSSAAEKSWWNKEWTLRKKIAVEAAGSPGAATVLVRLHEGNFAFGSVKDDAADLRAVAADDKTLLPFHVEKIDPLLNEAFVWVKLPDLSAATSFWLYYGNANAPQAGDPKASYDAETVAVYHFAEHGAAAADATGNANNAAAAGVAADGTIIGTGLRLDGRTLVKVPASASLKWDAGAALTWSAWVKLAAVPANGVLFSRREGANGFVIGADAGVPFVEVTDANGTQRTTPGEALTPGIWRHLAVTAGGGKVTLYLDGASYGAIDATLPALNSELVIGGEAEGAPEGRVALTGELDELQLAKVARPAAALKFAALSQGTTDQAAKLIAIGNDEESGHAEEGELGKHLTLLSDISKSLTPDGWIVIFLCTLLALVGGVVSVLKFLYLTKITKATGAFLRQWEHLSADLSILDHGDEASIKSMGGQATPKAQKILRQSPLYHLYQIGFAEIQHRVANAREEFRGLSGRSMEAIKATLDGGLVREVQRLNSQLVFLTIGIAGGPYLGLLGTVIGVMITFAVIAKSGEVEVNSIAPGIAGALLATVAGLAVAIPALFAYSYISSRIKDAVSDMQVFIDEFVAKIAEAYPEAD